VATTATTAATTRTHWLGYGYGLSFFSFCDAHYLFDCTTAATTTTFYSGAALLFTSLCVQFVSKAKKVATTGTAAARSGYRVIFNPYTAATAAATPKSTPAGILSEVSREDLILAVGVGGTTATDQKFGVFWVLLTL
jgi:hypothetical protein